MWFDRKYSAVLGEDSRPRDDVSRVAGIPLTTSAQVPDSPDLSRFFFTLWGFATWTARVRYIIISAHPHLMRPAIGVCCLPPETPSPPPETPYHRSALLSSVHSTHGKHNVSLFLSGYRRSDGGDALQGSIDCDLFASCCDIYLGY